MLAAYLTLSISKLVGFTFHLAPGGCIIINIFIWDWLYSTLSPPIWFPYFVLRFFLFLPCQCPRAFVSLGKVVRGVKHGIPALTEHQPLHAESLRSETSETESQSFMFVDEVDLWRSHTCLRAQRWLKTKRIQRSPLRSHMAASAVPAHLA